MLCAISAFDAVLNGAGGASWLSSDWTRFMAHNRGSRHMKFENQTFTTDVTLDCNEFIDCVLKDCLISHQGGWFSMTRTRLENVRFGVGGPAQNVVSFLRMVRVHNRGAVEELLDGVLLTTPEPAGTAG
jgi:hypothetical protein